MKYFMILLSLMPLALGREVQVAVTAQERSISSQIVDAIEAFKEQMPCGFPGLGLPILAPLTFGHKEINIDGDSIKAHGEISNFVLNGLNDFDIEEFKINLILSRADFRFNFNHVYLTTDYEMATDLSNIKAKRSGLAKFAIKNLAVWGRITYRFSALSGTIRLNKFNLYVSLDEVNSEIGGLSKIPIINKKLNQIIEEWIMLAINDNTDNISDLTNEYLVPVLNEVIADVNIYDIIGGSGSASDGNDQPRETCVPPAIL